MPRHVPYEDRLRKYSFLDLVDIADHLDKALFPERHALVQAEITRRWDDGSAREALARLKYDTFMLRLVAALIDGLVFLPVALADMFVLRNLQLLELPLFLLWLILTSFAYVGYEILMHGCYGQTLGKMAMRVKVMSLDETPLSMKQAAMRSLVPLCLVGLAFLLRLRALFDPVGALLSRGTLLAVVLLSLANIGWFLLEAATMLANSKRRALHDFIAGSVVVWSPDQRMQPTGMGRAADAQNVAQV